MARFSRLQRLFVAADIMPDTALPLERAQAHYLLNVLRKGAGDPVLVFNGRDGEWRAEIVPEGRKGAALVPRERVRAQPDPPDLELLFAPLKRERLDYAIQKAVEMGAGRIRPVVTHRTQGRFNLDRARANALEAAEQCGILAIPDVEAPRPLAEVLDGWDGRTLIFCDEDEGTQNPLPALETIAPNRTLAVLIGPEGGFSDDERARLRAMPCVRAIPLGPRVLRADTAMVAAMAVVQAMVGDWR